MPEITVLMPVRNGERYIKESIDSVLNQTLTDFEFLIIDDGSTDRTVEIIQGYTDKRIRLVRKEHQFIQNLNEGLELASGSYIARMDADDIMHTERLRIQLKRMKKNPDITVCGTYKQEYGNKYYHKKSPQYIANHKKAAQRYFQYFPILIPKSTPIIKIHTNNY